MDTVAVDIHPDMYVSGMDGKRHFEGMVTAVPSEMFFQIDGGEIIFSTNVRNWEISFAA